MKEKNSFVVYPYPKDEHTEEENTKEIVSKSIYDDLIIPSLAIKDEKSVIYIAFIIDSTYYMSKIYNILYRRLCEEIDELKKLEADVFIKISLSGGEGYLEYTEFENDAEKLKEKLLNFEFKGGSDSGYEEYLNVSLINAINKMDKVNNASIKGVILLTDSAAKENSIPDFDLDSAYIDFVNIYAGEPQTDNFISLKNKEITKIQEFLSDSNKGLIHEMIKNKMQS